MKRIIHIITGLEIGGAEKMLYKLLKYSGKGTYYHEVISLLDEGVIGEKIKALGVKIHLLHLNKKNTIEGLLRARNICKNFDVVNTWLYDADIFGYIVAKILLRKKLIWNIRQSNLDRKVNKIRTINIIKINSILSERVDCITYNSYKAYETHKEVGYSNKNSVVIPNGFELDKFIFDRNKREKIRTELSLSDQEKVLITVGRWDVQKDYYTLLKALSELKKQSIEFKMIIVGTNLDSFNIELNELINKYGLKDNIILLGQRMDIPDLLSAADIYVSSSLGESFSNAIGEAMACELPCVVTDVGDSRIIVGEHGRVVKAQDYLDMAHQIRNYLKLPQIDRNKNARIKIMENYEIQAIVKRIEDNIWAGI